MAMQSSGQSAAYQNVIEEIVRQILEGAGQKTVDLAQSGGVLPILTR